MFVQCLSLLFVLVFLYVLFSLFSFVLRFWPFLLALLLRPLWKVKDEGEGCPKMAKIQYGVKPDIFKYAALPHWSLQWLGSPARPAPESQ